MSAPNRKRRDNRPWLKAMNFVTNRHDTYSFIDPSRANLTGRSMLITGASKGIGRMTAIHFAQAGCSKIALAACSDLAEVANACKEAAAKAGHTEPLVLSLNVDVSSEASVKAAAETVGKEFDGKLDVLITNAGYLETWKPITETDPGEWWKTWDVNINGTFLCMHYFLPMVLSSETKTLITLSSAGGHSLGYGASSYQTTKFATCRLTEFADAEYGDQGLIAIALHPGGVKTELANNMPAEMHTILIDEPELPADVMVWLAAEPRDWLSGRFVSACWDMQELEGKKEEIIAKDLLKFRMVI